MKSLLLVPLILLVGCIRIHTPEELDTYRKDPVIFDQCIRAEQFKQCMARIPQGATSISAEVVEECAKTAKNLSWRQTSQIKPECRAIY